MKFLQYFFFLASNWGLRIAFVLTREEITGEKKYAIDTTGADELNEMEKSGVDISHATMYMPASYSMLERFLQETKPGHLLDIGSGKGRTLCVAAWHHVMTLTGIDFNKKFCEVARLNLSKTQKKFPGIHFTIYHNDAFYFEIPITVDCIFMFNPFDEVIMSGVLENIITSLASFPRTLTVIYFNPMHKDLFLHAGFTEVYNEKRLNYLEGCILKSPEIRGL